MREHVRAFVAAAAEAMDLQAPIYEFGSYLVEGQNDLGDLRPLFAGKRYVGCDMRAGPGVDRIENLEALSLPDGIAQTVICVDTLEHVFDVRRAVDEMLRVLAPGGVIVLSVPMDFRIHAYPDDYWRLTPSCLERLLAPLSARIVGSQGVETYPHTVFAVGCKAPVPARVVHGAGHLVERFQASLHDLSGRLPWSTQLRRHLLCWLRSKGERRRWREMFATRFVVQMQIDRRLEHESLGLSHGGLVSGGRLDLQQ